MTKERDRIAVPGDGAVRFFNDDGTIATDEVRILGEIFDEYRFAYKTYGLKSVVHATDDRALTILAEELGEVAEVLNSRELGDRDDAQAFLDLRCELIQVAAVALGWLTSLDRNVAGQRDTLDLDAARVVRVAEQLGVEQGDPWPRRCPVTIMYGKGPGVPPGHHRCDLPAEPNHSAHWCADRRDAPWSFAPHSWSGYTSEHPQYDDPVDPLRLVLYLERQMAVPAWRDR